MLDNKKSVVIILGLIFLIALLFRFTSLSAHPTGFHIDEASLGYNGYSLLLTGRDDNGNFLPLYIDMFGDNRPSGYHYLTIIPIMLFGLTEFATRFPGALIGSITVFAMFLLANVIFKDKRVSLLSALLIAVSPWHIIVSRASGEAVITLFFIIIGFSLLFFGLGANKRKFIISGAILTSVSYFFYHTPRVFVPLMFATFAAFLYPSWRNQIKHLRIKVFFVFIFLCGVALILIFFVKGGTGRYSQVNIFNNFETNFFMWQQLQEDALGLSPKYISRVVHNVITNNFLVFADNYFDYVSGEFLFVKGGLPNWYNVPRMGLMYIIELPFLLFGIYWLLKSNNKMYKIPLLWLLVAPMVPAITMDDIPNINRSIVMVPALELIAAIGFLKLANVFQNKKLIFMGLCSVLLIANIFYFGHQYFINAKTHKNWYRNNGFSKMMNVVNENYDNYDAIVISKFQGGIYPLVLFYSKYDPIKYQKEGSSKNPDYGGFGKFFFAPQDCPSQGINKKMPKFEKTLYIDKGDCPSTIELKEKKVSFINREDGTKAFRIVYE